MLHDVNRDFNCPPPLKFGSHERDPPPPKKLGAGVFTLGCEGRSPWIFRGKDWKGHRLAAFATLHVVIAIPWGLGFKISS